jgi:hypothetical protein
MPRASGDLPDPVDHRLAPTAEAVKAAAAARPAQQRAFDAEHVDGRPGRRRSARSVRAPRPGRPRKGSDATGSRCPRRPAGGTANPCSLPSQDRVQPPQPPDWSQSRFIPPPRRRAARIGLKPRRASFMRRPTRVRPSSSATRVLLPLWRSMVFAITWPSRRSSWSLSVPPSPSTSKRWRRPSPGHAQARRQQLHAEQVALAQRQRAHHFVLQFAHIARPAIGQQAFSAASENRRPASADSLSRPPTISGMSCGRSRRAGMCRPMPAMR